MHRPGGSRGARTRRGSPRRRSRGLVRAAPEGPAFRSTSWRPPRAGGWGGKARELCLEQLESWIAHERQLAPPHRDAPEVDVREQKRLLVPRRLGDDVAPWVDDVRAAPVREACLLAYAIHEHHIALEHLGVEADEIAPVRLSLRDGSRAAGGKEQDLGPVVDRECGQEGLPRVVADKNGHASERRVEGAHRLAGLEETVLLERRVARQIQLAVDVERRLVLGVDRAVVAPVAVALVEADQCGHAVGERCGVGRRAGRLVGDTPQRVAAQLKLGEDDEVSAAGARSGDRLAGPALVRLEIAQAGIELCQRDSHAPAPYVCRRVRLAECARSCYTARSCGSRRGPTRFPAATRSSSPSRTPRSTRPTWRSGPDAIRRLQAHPRTCPGWKFAERSSRAGTRCWGGRSATASSASSAAAASPSGSRGTSATSWR